jgi:hypothetical protein
MYPDVEANRVFHSVVLARTEELPPVVGLGDGFENAIALYEECAHIPLQKQNVSEPSERAKRGRVVEHIAHERTALGRLEIVDMVQTTKRPAHHLVPEARGALELGDMDREMLPDAEVPRPPRHLLPQTD